MTTNGSAPPRRATSARRLRSALVVALLCAAGGTVVALTGSGHAATPTAKLTPQQIAKLLIDHGHNRFATLGAQRALEFTAGENQSAGRSIGDSGRLAATRPAAGGAPVTARLGLANVRVNNPALDTHETDQTTQSETTVAVSGRHVAVGFNDSQQALLALTDGMDLTGYAYSTDGGASFTDGGTLPNPLNFVNLGDPWMASDRAGRMYYSTLTYGGNVGNLEVAVGRSDDGGRTWSTPTLASPNNDNNFYQGDKDAITVGRDPKVASRDNLYAAWDDMSFDVASESSFNGLPVAASIDHGRTWSLHYADKIVSDPASCSFAQYIGAQPLVDPANGTLYVAAEKLAADDCTGSGGVVRSEVIFKSTNGGVTFSRAVTVSAVTAAFPTDALELGPGIVVRTIEFPALAIHGATLWLAWNDGQTGHSHIQLATSTTHGATWDVNSVTSGTGDEIQPAVAADATGLHVAYYQRNANNTFDTVVADSTDSGIHFAKHAVTSQSFPGVRTIPQFDPQIAFGYMGDYIAMISNGGHQYFAWGDNRDRLTDFTHPNGRNDPDVFFARR